MGMFSFKDLFYICKVNVRDLETKEVVQTSIKSDIWVPHSELSDKEFLVESGLNLNLDPNISYAFMSTFDEYIYPRIVAEYSELFKKNFKILDKYFKNDFVSKHPVQTEHSRLAYLKFPEEQELEQDPDLYAVFWSCYCYTNFNFELASRKNIPTEGKECGLLDYKFYLYKRVTDEKEQF